jgi:fructosamine-3-kinase
MEELNKFLYRTKLAKPGDEIVWTPLAGGVSSDIWRVDLPGQTVCVKRALAKLKVAADWTAPVERNNYEWEWFRFVEAHFPELVPRPIAHDAELGMLAMEFLPPAEFTNWKTELLGGTVDVDFAGKVGTALGRIHAESAGDEKLQKLFDTDELFFALRIEPYLLATAENYPDIKAKIKAIAERTLGAKIALVHGDVSPKNILKGKDGPVFLDAETAWYGDPAFDVAFCLNHFLLKSVHSPEHVEALVECFKIFTNKYAVEVTWESAASLDDRIAKLLPILTLARIDGKSPVEYLTDEKQRSFVRNAALNIFTKQSDLGSIADSWRVEVQRTFSRQEWPCVDEPKRVRIKC